MLTWQKFRLTRTPSEELITNLYSYDSDDTFINADGEIIDMATFEEEAEGQGIDVLVYNEDGSIFRLKAATQNN